MKKALIIGYGSIGMRHAKILKKLNFDVNIFSRRNIKDFEKFESLEHAMLSCLPEYIIVCNETSKHYETLKKIEKFNFKNILIEKPIFSNLKKSLNFKKNKIFVGYNLRFHPLIKKLKDILLKEKILSVEVSAGSYLPNWRKSIEYEKNYSINKDLGGGVIRDLSHELDYLIWLFGPINHLIASGGHYSNLAGNSEDIYKMIFKMKRCNSVSLNLDYLNRLVKREITVITEKDTIVLDLISNKLTSSRYKTIKLKKFNINSTFEQQHKNIINKQYNNICTFDEGIKLVEIISKCEKSNKLEKWIKI